MSINDLIFIIAYALFLVFLVVYSLVSMYGIKQKEVEKRRANLLRKFRG